MKILQGLTFDDLLLVPKYSKIESRRQVDLFVDWGRGIKTLPIISANMKHVTESSMALAMATNNCMALLHRFDSTENRLSLYRHLIDLDRLCPNNYIGPSFGATKEELALFKEFHLTFGSDMKIVCIDVAHGHSELCINAIKEVKSIHPDCLLIAGNIATSDAAYDLIDAGADVLKCGIGGGSICSTRIETGNGVPQVTALDDIWDYIKNRENRPKLIADGGLSKAGNIVKALCFADGVMLGNMLAGTLETPGDTIYKEGVAYKVYAGSSTFRQNNVEGYSGLVPYKGPVENVLKGILEGIQSGCSYQGCDNVGKLKNDPIFVRITNAGQVESGAHNIIL